MFPPTPRFAIPGTLRDSVCLQQPLWGEIRPVGGVESPGAPLLRQQAAGGGVVQDAGDAGRAASALWSGLAEVAGAGGVGADGVDGGKNAEKNAIFGSSLSRALMGRSRQPFPSFPSHELLLALPVLPICPSDTCHEY